MFKDLSIYAGAALAEIAGCMAFWLWLRDGASAWVALGGVVLLVMFAGVLTRVDSNAAGRAFAAYGGIYILFSVLWLRVAEGVRPTVSDLVGAAVSMAGAAIIMAGARHIPPSPP
jgi:small multidrug resistance family-3 protein